jgi:hypothetical protein
LILSGRNRIQVLAALHLIYPPEKEALGVVTGRDDRA